MRRPLFVVLLPLLLVLSLGYAQEAPSGPQDLSSTLEAPAISPMAIPPRDSVPDMVKRPQRGESPRFPRDTVIGELGRGRAGDSAYAFAREFLEALQGGDKDAGSLKSLESGERDRILELLKEIGPRKYRLGGGREEVDGSVSFLFRFIGREKSLAGELYLRREGTEWICEDLINDEVRDRGSKNEYRYDFTPYERFF